jgi:cell division septal protein FtsQ
VIGLLSVTGGFAVALWGRALLARIPYFNVRRVEVVGTRWTAPDSLLRLAAIAPDHSVWDDHEEIESRLTQHPLIEEASIRRSGRNTLRIVVREVEPLALVGMPELRAVREDGTVLPIDPASASLDLPVLTDWPDLADDSVRVEGGPAARALELFAALHRLDPGLAALASDVALTPDGGLMIRLLESQPARRLAVPAAIDEKLARRIRATFADLRGRGIDAGLVEARFADQIVVRRRRERK